MKLKDKTLSALLLGILMPSMSLAQGNSLSNSDSKQMQGVWHLIYQESEQKKLPDEKTAEEFHGQMTFNADKIHYTVELPGFDFEFSYKVDTSRQPKWIDLELIDGADHRSSEHKLLGIYRLNKDTLDICYGITNRPGTFSADEGSGNVLIRLKR